MKTNEKEVRLTVICRGRQTTRGRFGFEVHKDGEEMHSKLVVHKATGFAESKHVIPLSSQFVQGAIEEAPKHWNMKESKWRTIPEKKRIDIHIKEYVRDMFPHNQSYSYEIL